MQDICKFLSNQHLVPSTTLVLKPSRGFRWPNRPGRKDRADGTTSIGAGYQRLSAGNEVSGPMTDSRRLRVLAASHTIASGTVVQPTYLAAVQRQFSAVIQATLGLRVCQERLVHGRRHRRGVEAQSVRVPRSARKVGVAALAVLALAAPGQLDSQSPTAATPRWKGELTAISVNAALGGLTAGVFQAARGGSFWTGFTRGAVGGGVVYAGKRVSVEDFWGAGLFGRQLAAVGSSVVRNASRGQPTLEHLVLPVGPLRLYLDRGQTSTLQVRFDLISLMVTLYGVATPDWQFDLSSSISAGAPVFHTPEWSSRGWQAAGVILIRGHRFDNIRESVSSVFAHERVHVIQYDFSYLVWSEPAERWLMRHVPAGTPLSRYFDLGLSLGIVSGLNRLLQYDNRPWEREAHFLSGSR